MEDLIEQANEIQYLSVHDLPVEQHVADALRMGGTNQVSYELDTRATRGFLL
jgi:hypothetical protein